jgi:DNA sulfur modification protein DndE
MPGVKHPARLFAALLLSALSLAAAPHLYMAGDSTMADKPSTPPNLERGWGQLLRERMVDPSLLVNLAVNGRSTKSFIAEGRWQKLVDALQPGDFVILQFGHNDEKESAPERYAPPHGAYRDNLARFVAEVRARGAEPVLATSICRRKFDTQGRLVDTHGDYTLVVRELAAGLHVALIDLHVSTWQLLERLGPEDSKGILMWVPAGKYPELPQGKQDDTHLNEAGARLVAGLAVAEMRAKHLPLAALFRDSQSGNEAPSAMHPEER